MEENVELVVNHCHFNLKCQEYAPTAIVSSTYFDNLIIELQVLYKTKCIKVAYPSMYYQFMKIVLNHIHGRINLGLFQLA